MFEPTAQLKQTQWHPNRNYLQLSNGIIADSCFPGGNIASATIISASPLTIEVEGNTDVSMDTASKYWLYFRLRGFRKDKPLKIILKNANHLRKYYGQTRYRPYMMCKEEEENWQACPNPIDITTVQNGQLQGSFTYQSEKQNNKITKSTRSTYELCLPKEEKVLSSTDCGKNNYKKGDCYFAVYQPYSYDDLLTYVSNLKAKHCHLNANSNHKHNNTYFHQETITYSYERRKIHLLTITSTRNIESFSQREPVISEEIFPTPKDRPHKLKNNPIIMVTARVHPSQTSSSFYAEGLIDFLLSDSRDSALLRQLFIFQIIPMLNPDGVQHGNFRFDHQMRNLNRYYGQASIDKTPSIRAAELLILYYKNRNNEQCEFTQFYEETYNRLFMYIDVHGHSSAMPSFIYGNHSEKIEHLIENKMFCKLIESNFIPSGFSRIQSEFSKKNMTVQEKYDDFSKLCAGRVFAGSSDLPEMNIFHSYTMQVMPYGDELPRKKLQKTQKISPVQYAALLGKQTMISLLDLLDLNPQSRVNELQLEKMRRCVTKQCYNEQVRKAFLFRRAESSADRNSYSEISKMRQNCSEKQINFICLYALRWFNNPIFLKHLQQKLHCLKEPKFARFYQKLLNSLQKPTVDTEETPIKESKPKPQQAELKSPQKLKIRDTSFKREERQDSGRVIRSSKCFISRDQKRTVTQEKICLGLKYKQRAKIESKISKQTIQLNQNLNQLITKPKIQKDPVYRFPKRQYAAKKQSTKKDSIQSPQRKEKQCPIKLYTEETIQKHANPLFEIKIKEIGPKNKTNIRVQTEGVTAQIVSATAQTDLRDKIKSCNSHGGQFNMSTKTGNKKNQLSKQTYHKPSFLDEFIIKIKEQRDNEAPSASKQTIDREEIKQKAMKLKPTIKEMIEQQDKNLLPVLRRNKIFTIMSEPTQKETINYDTIQQNRKRANTLEEEIHVNQFLAKNKKKLVSNKPENSYRDHLLKRSQEYLGNYFS